VSRLAIFLSPDFSARARASRNVGGRPVRDLGALIERRDRAASLRRLVSRLLKLAIWLGCLIGVALAVAIWRLR
jgi:hypothetical protein